MFVLSALGSAELRGLDGTVQATVLRQPKRFALLVYLALGTRPGGFMTRDRLLGVFWPDMDLTRGRAALRQTLAFLSQAMGADVIQRRSSEELGVNPRALSCDVWDFHRYLASGSMISAVECYGGRLMEGFFLSRLPEFDRWLESNRYALHERAGGAAWGVSVAAAAQGRLEDAATWGKRALDLTGYDECHAAHLMKVLVANGDRIGALRVYRGLGEFLQSEFELGPSPELVELAGQIQAGTLPEFQGALGPPGPPSTPSRDRRSERERRSTPTRRIVSTGPPEGTERRVLDDRRDGADRRSGEDRRRRIT